MENVPKDFLTFRSGITNIYLLPSGGKYILVDAGMEKKAHAFFIFLSRHRIVPDSIDYIFLTHTHYDHTGGIVPIQEVSHAAVVVHAAESGFLRQGFTPPPRGTRFHTRILSFLGTHFFRNVSRYPSVEPDIVWDREPWQPDEFPAFALHTPGHSGGSSTLVWKEKSAFVGDTLFGMNKEDCYPWFITDKEMLLKSWEKLLATECQIFYPAHGKPVSRKVLEESYLKHLKNKK